MDLIPPLITLQEHGGASVLVGNDMNHAKEEFHRMLTEARSPIRPELWDGKTAQRILQELLNYTG